MKRICELFTNLFPLWVIGGGALALYYPPVITSWFDKGFIPVGLGIIMLGMGLTLKIEDFQRIFKYPLWIFLGLFLQYTLMPLLGFALSRVFELPPSLAVGLILVSCCPGGTASNVITYLSKANVALSVTMTAVSTLLAIVLTPLMTKYLVGQVMAVDAFKLFLDTVCVVLLPIVVGVSANKMLPRFTTKIEPVAPPVAVIMIVLIVSFILAAGRESILDGAMSLFGAVITLHLLGFAFGYGLSKFILKREDVARTISIEVGMQNSGLGVYLAKNNFADPVTAIPAAISALTHCIYGSIVAFYWRRKK